MPSLPIRLVVGILINLIAQSPFLFNMPLHLVLSIVIPNIYLFCPFPPEIAQPYAGRVRAKRSLKKCNVEEVIKEVNVGEEIIGEVHKVEETTEEAPTIGGNDDEEQEQIGRAHV